MVTPQDMQFCNQPAFDAEHASYQKQSYIGLGNGVGIYDVQEFKHMYPAIAKRYLKKTLPNIKPTRAYVLYVPQGIQCDTVVTLPTIWNKQLHRNNIYIILASQAAITVQHDLLSKSINNIMCILEPHAQLTLLQNNRHAHAAYNCITSFGQTQSTFSMYGFYTRSTHTRIETVLQEQHAQSDVRIGYLGNNTQTCWIKTLQHHQAAHTQSTSLVKGMLYDQSHAHHLGMIEIDKDTQQVIASQHNKFILMHDHAQAFSEPSLKVLAHDVQCAHGSAIGSFDNDQLLYMMARGLDRQDAIALLKKAFFKEVLVLR